MGGLAGPVGFDAADRLGGGPPDGASVLTVQVDGDDLGGDVDGDYHRRRAPGACLRGGLRPNRQRHRHR